MGAWRLAFGPQLAVIALIGAGAAGCSDSSRFDNNPFASENTGSRSEVTGSIPKSSNSVESKPLPHLASNGGDGYSGGGRGMGSYQPSQPASSDVTGSLPPAASVGVASFYTAGARTANGERLNPNALTAAHPSLPFGTRLRITSVASGRSVVVRVNDRGPFIKGRAVDVSYSAAKELGMTERGVAKVKMEVVQER